MTTPANEIIIKDTHRGLWYEDGVLTRIVGAGRYEVPRPGGWGWRHRPRVEVVLVDMRARELTLKNQEILTSDKVAVRVSILVQFAVSDPRVAVHAVSSYEDRLYSDVQLAARRSLASMTLEDILTNRHQLSEDILREVKSTAAAYGVAIARADVKDLIFPGNLQDIMNKVLAAERTSEAQLVEARTRAEVQRITAQAQAEVQRLQAEADTEARRLQAQAQIENERLEAQAKADATRLSVQTELHALEERSRVASAYATHPALLRLEELVTLRELARNANARLYLDFGGQQTATSGESERAPE